MIWHNAEINKILDEMGVDSDKGLHSGIADERITIYGKNNVSGDERVKYSKHLLSSLNSKFNYLLLALAALLVIFGIAYGKSNYFAPVFIVAVVIINAMFSAYYKFKSMRAFSTLTTLINPNVTVLRDGIVKQIPSDYLVPGDIIMLKSGDYVTADARLIECSGLSANEIAVTGETFPVEKHADMLFDDITPITGRANMLYAGSNILTGAAKAVVVETGLNTEIGKNQEIIEQTGSEKLPINNTLNNIGKAINLIIALICVFVFGISVLRNLHTQESFASLTVTMIANAVALGIAAIPESLPAVSVIVVALGLERILKNHIIVKKIKVLELLGKTNVICVDKTGILTKSMMNLDSIYDGETIFHPAKNDISEKNAMALKLTTLCSTLVDDATEQSIENACTELCGTGKAELENVFPRLAVIPFDTQRKAMTTVNMINGSPLAIVKGAPEYVIERCTACDREAIEKTHRQMTENGLRVLCVAIKNLDEAPANPSAEEIETDLTFVALIGLNDPPRAGAVEGIKICGEAGIKTVMITGDSLSTAISVAKQIGVLKDETGAISGEELSRMSDEDLLASVEKYSVYARITPADKLRIINAWQTKGMIVTVTGDNSEDADALSEADVGCVMGKGGTDVARGTADLVIEKNNFKYLVDAVKESRGLFENIKKSICYILGCNFAEILVYIICILTAGFPPLAAVQLLLLNLFTDSAPTISLATEKPDNTVMKKRPITLNGRLFDFSSVIQISAYSIFITAITLIAFATGKSAGRDIAVTMTFLTLTLTQLLHAFNMKSNLSLLRTDLKSNKFMNYSTVILAFLTMFTVLTPVGFAFNLTILPAGKFFICVGLSLLILPFGELVKMLSKRIEP